MKCLRYDKGMRNDLKDHTEKKEAGTNNNPHMVHFISDKAGQVTVCPFSGWDASVFHILDRCGLSCAIAKEKTILIKPNLVEAKAPPVTTPVGLVEAIIRYLRQKHPDIAVIVGEGAGASHYDTWHAFARLGYTELAARCSVELVDLNEAGLVRHAKKKCRRFPEIYLPRLLFDSFLISVPVLKAHTLAGVTLTMKNMMGVAPPSHYQQGGPWKKASFHKGIHEALLDLNRYRCPDFTLLDATVGMQKAHLWGPHCDPPPNLLAASYDPVSIDAYGTRLLGRNWQDIEYIRMAHGELGLAEPLAIIHAEGEHD